MAQMKVFVSHSSTDNSFCQALVHALRDAGADVWFDQENLGPVRLLDAIMAELDDRPVFIVVLSPAAFASEWVRQECKWAWQL